ncbi:hypothetical protein B296_00010968 [Ensete ventricosum]|uniref:Uncharacterized protein n=1 Tax=Ensete ventricosum TaxID=4639 RepID=A0A427B9X9_ENSVE|nr:hypothetical protein B296_00010968 [Ensete ventricosum]
MRTNKLRRMHSAQRVGWLSSSYGSTLATKLDDAQELRGIANSKISVLMQGIQVHLRRQNKAQVVQQDIVQREW